MHNYYLNFIFRQLNFIQLLIIKANRLMHILYMHLTHPIVFFMLKHFRSLDVYIIIDHIYSHRIHRIKHEAKSV